MCVCVCVCGVCVGGGGIKELTMYNEVILSGHIKIEFVRFQCIVALSCDSP